MSPRKNAALSAAALVLAAGHALADFTLQPHCNNNWYGECSFNPACPGGGFPTFNNWGYNNCTGGLPTPGAGDAVHLGSNALNINGAVSIGSLDESAGASIAWTNGDVAIASPFANTGPLTITAGNVVLQATINNSATITEVSGYNRYFRNATVNNTGVVEWQSLSWQPNAGFGQFNSSATVRKTTGGSATLSSMGVSNTGGSWDVQGGSLVLSNCTVSSNSSVSYTVQAGSSFQLNSCSLSGMFQGANNNSMQINSPSLAADTTFNISAGGLAWAGGDLTTGGHTLANTGLLYLTAGNVALDGPVTNSGTLVEVNGYNRYFTDASITNAPAGTLEWQSASWQPNGAHSAQFTNNGTLNKTTGSAANIAVPVLNNGPFHVSGGSVSFNSINFQSTAAAAYTIDPGTSLTLNSNVLSGTLAGTNSGSFAFNTLTLGADTTFNVGGSGITWSGGDLNTAGHTLTIRAPLTITTGNASLSGTIDNRATITEVNGYNRYFQNATVTNAPGATLEWQSVSWQPGAGTGLITNNGVLNKTTGGSGTVAIPFVNNSQLNVQGGGLTFANDTIQSAPAAAWSVGSAGLTFSGETTSGVFNGSSAGSFQQSNGWTLGADTTMNIGGNGLVWTSGDLACNSHTLTNQGLLVVTPGNVTLAGTIINTGTLVEVNGYNRSFQGTTITNQASGTVNWQSATWVPTTGGGQFTNFGSLTKTTGGSANVNVGLYNAGSIDLQGGTTTFTGNLVQSVPAASITIGAASLNFSNTQLSGTFNATNSGSAQINGHLSLAGPTVLNFTGNPIQWASGDLDASAFTLTNQGQVSIIAGNVALAGTLSNTGTLHEVSGYNRYFQNATISNSGTLELQSAAWQPNLGSALFTSSGVVTKTTGGTATLNVPVTNSGLIDIQAGSISFGGGLSQSAGETRLDGGTINGGTITLAGGRFDGNGSASASVNNTGGTLAPGLSAGSMTINGPYTQASAGNMEIDLAGSVETPSFDHLQVNGNATIAGTITVKFAPGFNPPEGSTFRFLDVSGTLTGVFGETALVNRPYSSDVLVSYDAHGATLTIVHRCGSADFNCDGDTGTDADIEAFFRCLAGNCTPGCDQSADFNYDGDTGTDQDIEAFFRVLGGGSC